MSLWSRLTNVFRPGGLERELDEELEFHMEERVRELTDAGLAREDAARQVALRFGNRLRLREESRDVKLLPWLDSLLRDVRLAARMMRKNAAVTAAAVVSLSLALGACVAAFSLVDALILRPLPVRQPDRLVYLTFPTYTPERPEADTFNDPLFLRLRDAGRGRVDLFAMSTQVMRRVTFGDSGGEKESVRTQFVSGDAFGLLGPVPALGRLFTRQDDSRPGDHPVAVVSHAFWMRRFGGDPAIVGRWFALDGDGRGAQGRQFQIVGVTEPRFTGVEPGRPTDLWLPYAMYNPRAFGNADFGWFRIVGRLSDNVAPGQAQSVLQAAFTNFRRVRSLSIGRNPSPERLAQFLNTPLYVRSAANGTSPLRREFARSLWILSAIAVLVLLIAGSNVANLFLARTAARAREMALRLSLGAGRGRLIQQMLAESTLVAAAACALGLLFAGAAAPSVVRMLGSADDPVHLDLSLHWRTVAFSAGLTVLTAALFGIAPALRASGIAPMTALKTGAGGAGVRVGVMRPFVAVQVAFGLVVLFVGSLLVLSFVKVSSVNPGFATSNVLVLSLEAAAGSEPNQKRAALLQVLDRLRGIPGVQAASAADYNAVGRAWTYQVGVPGTAHDTIEATMAPVTPGFFETMNIPMLAGRAFVSRDMDAGATVMIVSDAFARRYFGSQPAVGRVFQGRFGLSDDTAGQYEIVGVAADTRYDLRKPAAPVIYIPLPLRTVGRLYVRAAGDPALLASRLREEIRAANTTLRVTSVTSQSAVVDATLLRERLLAMLSGFFALVGLALAAVGLYGVLSYAVVQRTREIGIRVALGAGHAPVIRTVVAETGGAAFAGVAGGLAAALYLSRFVEALVFEVTPLDFWSVALPLGTLLVAAVLAASLPALRAMRVDPIVALRHE